MDRVKEESPELRLLQGEEFLDSKNWELAAAQYSAVALTLEPKVSSLPATKVEKHKRIRSQVDKASSSTNTIHVQSANTKRVASSFNTPVGNPPPGEIDLKTFTKSKEEWKPEKELSIGELTEFITSPPGRICEESTFGKLYAIYGGKCARDIFTIVKGTSVSSLQSHARWALIALFEKFCKRLLASPSLATKYGSLSPDPVLFSPVHDQNVMRFEDDAIYPTTTMLSNAARVFILELGLKAQMLSFSSLSLSCLPKVVPIHFHSDIPLKEKYLMPSSKSNWLDESPVPAMLEESQTTSLDVVNLYTLALMQRAYCSFQLQEPQKCINDCITISKIPGLASKVSPKILSRIYLLKARSLYQIGKQKKMTDAKNQMSIGERFKSEKEYLDNFKNAAMNYAIALEKADLSEFNSEMHECNIEMTMCLQQVLVAKRSDCQLKTCCLCWRQRPLKNSHIIPKGILRALTEKSKLLMKEELKGAAQVTYPMLCGDCEKRLDENGENDFIHEIFHKILDNPKQRHSIPFKRWLYYFLASVIWRLLFVGNYKNFKEVLNIIPFFTLRTFLLSNDTNCLTSDCLLYVFVDSEEHKELLCSQSPYKNLARKGISYIFEPFDENLCICHFLNFFVILPVGPLKDVFLIQGFVNCISFGEGLFSIGPDSERHMPVFLERFICMVAKEYDKVLSKIPSKTWTQLLKLTDKSGDSSTLRIPQLIRCLPKDISASVSFNSSFKSGIKLPEGMRLLRPPMVCNVEGSKETKQAVYICNYSNDIIMVLYRIYDNSKDHLYTFESVINTQSCGVDYISVAGGIISEQYCQILLQRDPSILDFLKNMVCLMWFATEFPVIQEFFIPPELKALGIQFQEDSLQLPAGFKILAKPFVLKKMVMWLCSDPQQGLILFVRQFCHVYFNDEPAYDYLAALRVQIQDQEVGSIDPFWQCC